MPYSNMLLAIYYYDAISYLSKTCNSVPSVGSVLQVRSRSSHYALKLCYTLYGFMALCPTYFYLLWPRANLCMRLDLPFIDSW